jgi:site-specific DNA-methyltransferase (adenine-specific)
MRNLWDFPVTPRSERVNGAHPSQKPLALVERAVLIASRPGELVLDPFGGTGTLAVAAARHERRWVLIEAVAEYAKLARKRLRAEGHSKATSSRTP